MNLASQKILITGASRGIGRACAELCAAHGASCVLVARDADKLEEVRSALPGEGHIALSADLSDPEQAVPELFKKACADNIKFTGMIHAAGVCSPIPLKVVNLKTMSEVFTINYFAFMLLIRYFIRPQYSTGGSIVGISSVASVTGWQGMSVYSGSKGAMNASIRSLALELAGKGFRLNAILPSNIKTDMLDSMLSVLDAEEVEKIKSKQPLGWGNPADVANAALFLLDKSSSFITGSVLPVDGGYTAI